LHLKHNRDYNNNTNNNLSNNNTTLSNSDYKLNNSLYCLNYKNNHYLLLHHFHNNPIEEYNNIIHIHNHTVLDLASLESLDYRQFEVDMRCRQCYLYNNNSFNHNYNKRYCRIMHTHCMFKPHKQLN